MGRLAGAVVLAVFIPASAMAATVSALEALGSDEKVSMDALKASIDNLEQLVLFDARDLKSYNEKHIRGAVLPMPEEYYRLQELFRAQVIGISPDADIALAEGMKEYPKDALIVVYCNDNCALAEHLSLKLKDLGFARVHVLDGGIQSWEKKGYPVETNSGL